MRRPTALKPVKSPSLARAGLASPMRTWLWAAWGGALGVFLACVVFAPAAWLQSPIAQASGGHVLLQEARGTIWDGSAQVILSGGQGSQDRAQVPGLLRWRLRPGFGQWSLALSPECCTSQPIAVSLMPGIGSLKVAVSDHQSRWPAALLSALGAPWNTLGLDASLKLQTKQVRLEWSQGRTQLQGEISLKALNTSSRLATLRPLGSYETLIQGGTAPTLSLRTLEGALLLSGQGQWTGNRLRFTGEASAAPEAEAALNNLLNIIGRRQGARSLITLG